MNQIQDASPDVLLLLSALCDNTTSQEDLDRLEESLGRDNGCLGLFLDYLQLDSDLYFELTSRKVSSAALYGIGSDPSTPSVPSVMMSSSQEARSKAGLSDSVQGLVVEDGVGPLPSLGLGFLPTPSYGTTNYFADGWPVAYLLAAVILGLGIVVSAVTYVSQPEHVASALLAVQKSRSLPEPNMPCVGRITGMVDCKWEEGSGFRVQGSGISQSPNLPISQSPVSLGDRFALSSGLLEITYDTGAKVILQGPVTYEAEANGGYLSIGKLTGRLEKGEGGRGKVEEAANHKSEIINQKSPFALPPSPFVVRTPTATVTDLGTEFGVDVDREGAARVYVFNGAVKIADKDRQQDHTVHTGEAAQVTPGMIRRMEPSEMAKRFVRAMRPHPGPALLPDDFSDGALYRAKWFTKTWAPLERASVVPRDGRVALKNRGYLVSRHQYNPDKLGGLEITGQWTFATDGDTLSILTRTDGVIAGPWGEVQNGLEFLCACGWFVAKT